MAVSNLRLKLFLQMVSNLRGPAREARRDLKSVKTEADALKRAGAGNKLATDVERISTKARAARRDLEAMGKAARNAQTGLNRDNKGHIVAAPTASSGRGDDSKGRSTKGGSASAGAQQDVGGSTVVAGGKRAVAAVGGYFAVREAIRRTVGEAISFEKDMADVKKKVELPEGKNWGEVERLITDTAIDLGKPKGEMAALTAELGASGIAYEDLGRSMRMSAAAAVAWDMPLAETTAKLMKMRSGNNYSLEQLRDEIDKINALSDAGASKERDVVEMHGRAVAGAKSSNVDQDTTLAYITGMNSVGVEPEIAARAWTTMVQKLRTAQSSGGKNMKDGLAMLGLTPKQIEQGMKRDASKTIAMVVKEFSKSKDQAAAGVKIFGEGWWDEFARMAQAAPLIAKFMDILREPKNWTGSSQRSLQIQLTMTATHLERLKTLASEIGDRMGRWALPPINDAIQKIVDKFKELDAEADRRKATDEIIRKVREGVPLTPEEQVRVANDPKLNGKVIAETRRGKQQRDSDTVDKAIVSMTGEDALDEHLKGRRRGIEREIEALEAGGKNKTPMQKLHIAKLRGEADALPQGEVPTPRFNHRPADQDDRERGIGSVQYLQKNIEILEEKLRAATALAANQPRDEGTQARIRRDQAILDQREKQVAPTFPRFGFGGGFRAGSGPDTDNQGQPVADHRRRAPLPPTPRLGFDGSAAPSAGGATAGAAPKPGGGAQQAAGGGIGRFDFARNLKARYQVDLQPEGGLIMDSLRRGIESGKAGVASSADTARQEIVQPFAAMDLSSGASVAMDQLASTITAKGDGAVAAARTVAQRVQAEFNNINGPAGGTNRGPSLKARADGSYHDGVTGQ